MPRMVLLFVSAFYLFSQQIVAQTLNKKNTKESNNPTSIYSFNSPLINKENPLTSFFDYKLPKFEFLQVNFRNIDVRNFTLNPANNQRVPTQFMARSFINIPNKTSSPNSKYGAKNSQSDGRN